MIKGNDVGEALLQHEFGHILQYRKFGPTAYWKIIAPESFVSATFTSSEAHRFFWTETYANYLSKVYFGNTWKGANYGYSAKNISLFNLCRIRAVQMGKYLY